MNNRTTPTQLSGAAAIACALLAVLMTSLSCSENASQPQPPSAPSGLSPVESTPTSLKISWTGIAGTTAYTIYRDDMSDALDTVTDTTFTSLGLPSGAQYTYRVASIVNGVESEKSAPLTVSTTCAAPASTSCMVLKTPNGCASYHVGDTMKITWNIGVSRSSIMIEFSADNGLSYLQIPDAVIQPDPSDTTFLWAIPDTLSSADGSERMSTVSDTGIVYIHEYTLGGCKDYSDLPVVIHPRVMLK